MKEQVKAAVAVLLVGALGWVLYAQASGTTLLPAAMSLALPPEPDTEKLDGLKEISSIQVEAALMSSPEYRLGGRNLFQYGPPKPPPPTPAQLEAMRKAEEARLKAMEEEARRRAEADQKRQQEEAALRAKTEQENLQRLMAQQHQLAKAPPPPPGPPPKPAPPPINLKLVGYLGPQNSRIAVFLNGNDIVLGKRGELIDGKFKVLSIGPESVEMGYADPTHRDQKKRIELGS